MPLVIENGWWAAGAAAIAIVGALLWVGRRGKSRWWRVVCVGMPVGAAFFLTLAMAGVGVVWGPRAQRVVLVLDLSESTRGSFLRDPAWVKGLVERRVGEGMLVTVVGFGGKGGPRVLLEDVRAGGKWPAVWSAGDLGSGEGSDVAGALGWRSARELRGEDAVSPRWVITDGFVEGVIGKEPFETGWTGVAPQEVDLGVVEVDVRGVGEGVDVLARIGATGKAEGRVEILRDGKEIGRQEVVFGEAGSRWVSVTDAEAKEGHHYEVVVQRISGGGKDRWGEDDRGEIEWVPETEAARVLVVGGEEGLAGLKGYRIGDVSAGNFPGDAEKLAEWQVVVLNDVPMMGEGGGVLPGYAGGVLDGFVREGGGGLLIVGRKHAFGPGHYAEMGVGKGTVEGLSALSSERLDRPAATVVFLLDGSGSMNEAAGVKAPEQKFRLAARGVEEAMGLLEDQDKVAVVMFNDRAEVVAAGTKGELLKSEGGENVLRRKLDGVKPTGSTVPDAALEEVARAAGVDAKEAGTKMVVLLTDGEIPAMDVGKWKAMLGKTGCGLTVVAPAPEGNSALQKLAKEVGAVWLTADDAGAWAVLLKRAVAGRMMGDVVNKPVEWVATEGTELRGVAGESIEVWKKGEAREIAAVQGEDRVLGAVVQRGLGKVAGIAMGGGNEHAAYDELLARVVKEIQASAGDRRFTVAARREQDGWVVSAEGIDDGKFLDGMGMRFRSFDSDGARMTEMRQVGAGTYEGRVRGVGALTGVVVRDDEGAEKLVGRVRAGRVAGREWPATFDAEPVAAPPGAEVISGDANVEQVWRPRVRERRWRFDEEFWIAGAVAAVAALWLRRGRGQVGNK